MGNTDILSNTDTDTDMVIADSDMIKNDTDISDGVRNPLLYSAK